MLITNTNIDIWYREYVNQYKKSTKYAKSRGGVVRGIEMMNKSDFRMDLISMHEDHPKLSGKEIAKKLAKMDVYKISSEQARVSAERHVARFGGEFNMSLVNRYRIGALTDIYDAATELRKQLKAEGLKNSVIEIIVGQELFGSE